MSWTRSGSASAMRESFCSSGRRGEGAPRGLLWPGGWPVPAVVDTYASGKADGGLEDYILQVWRFSQSNPWPGQWIAACKKELSEETDGDLDGLENAEWMRFLVRDVKRQAGEFAGAASEPWRLPGRRTAPRRISPCSRRICGPWSLASEAETYKEICGILSAPMFGRLAAVRGKDVDPEKRRPFRSSGTGSRTA